MRKIILILSALLLAASLASADNGPYHYNRVTRTATAVSAANTYTATAWVPLTGSTLECKSVTIAEDTRSLGLKIAFTQNDIDNGSYWYQAPGDGPFMQVMKPDPNFGIKINTTITTGGCNATVRLLSNN